MANLETIGPDIKASPLNNNFAALNSAKMEKTADGNLNMNNNRITNLGAPTTNGDSVGVQDSKLGYVGPIRGRYPDGTSIRDMPGNVITYTASGSTPDLPSGFTGGDGMLMRLLSLLNNGNPQHTVQFWWHAVAGSPKMFMQVHNQNFDEWSNWYEILTTRHIIYGTGNPNGNVAAGVGTLYINQSGGSGTTLYYKASGTGNTGWQAVA